MQPKNIEMAPSLGLATSQKTQTHHDSSSYE
jgi:hypothetical protein